MPATTDPKAKTVHLPPELLARLQERAAKENCSADELVAEVVAEFLDDAEWIASVEQARRSMSEGKGRPFEEVAEELRRRANDIAR